MPTHLDLAALALAHCIILGIAWLRYRWIPHRRALREAGGGPRASR
ncbi:MAG: hypothetical protein H6732_15725 [Alphaproteobacteria bacterium]|nr:hypothetical protein [Alphaproteobacteria bacterium]